MHLLRRRCIASLHHDMSDDVSFIRSVGHVVCGIVKELLLIAIQPQLVQLYRHSKPTKDYFKCMC